MRFQDLPAEVLAVIHPETQMWLLEVSPAPGMSDAEAALHWMTMAAGMHEKWRKDRKEASNG